MNFLDHYLPVTIVFLLFAVYLIVIVYTVFRILLDTNSTSKTLAYLLFVMMLPVLGVIFYYSFGINTRRIKSNKQMGKIYKEVSAEFDLLVKDKTDISTIDNKNFLSQYGELVRFLKNLGNENLTSNNFKLLINGEEKFPEVLKMMAKAENHIHMEYYAWENDSRGNQIKDILLQKVKQGVKVRVIYDAYASRKITNNIVAELRNGGAEIYPIIKVKLLGLANRINHRDHRKIIVIDGNIGFVGGINISDRYDNSIDTGLYWRDTHVMITGPGVANLQRHFIINWSACQPNKLKIDQELFPQSTSLPNQKPVEMSQIIAGGPIYPMSNIMLTYAKIFSLAQKKLFITNPYFIPNETILDTLKLAAKSGIDVRIILPQKSDSAIVGAASKFYFNELLYAGVKIYLYKKGFIHAKTVVADNMLSVVGTANMDIRSFDLNFEIMSVVYGQQFATRLEEAFMNDLEVSDEVHYDEWMKQSKLKLLTYAVARLISSFL